MAQADLEEDLDSGSGFARFLFFVTPILFTVVLLAVLLTLFNMNVRAAMIDFGNKIPIVRNFVPDPEGVETAGDKEEDEAKKQAESTEATVKELKDQVAQKDAELEEANRQATAQEDKVKQLQAQLDAALAEAIEKEETAKDEAYQKEVKKLSQLYAQMSPSKAAAILEKLTIEETLQMLSLMNNESKVAILEKMDPAKAADISILLKDAKPADDMAIAALQSRLKKDAESSAQAAASTAGLDDKQLGQTFAGMSADAASKLIIQTHKISPDKALKILNAVDDGTRSKILAAMTKEDEELTAKILNKLVSK
ncbi:hypothetical protein QNH46_10830 [Paenibacillus woosongensis]|uniref:Kinesin n=1 Tax=Paenibacillus woosongensis TaxID=307580 RepID=A0AA95IDD7_9BACL|nr:hypothetical protein [Paenibacillus woosongensis]WHX51092.1 hypothetical protein QNH46_10830 [Paenibacillus woosongensis]